MKRLNAPQVKALFENKTAAEVQRFLTDFLPLLDEWLSGGFLEGKKKYATDLELAASKDDYHFLISWLLAFRGCGKVEPESPLFFAYRDKKESKSGKTLQWSYKRASLTTWVPDAIAAVAGPENQGTYTTTTLIQCKNLPSSSLLMDYVLLGNVLSWVRSNKAGLFKQSAMNPKTATVLKPKLTSLLRKLSSQVTKHRYFLVYLNQNKLEVTVVGSYNAAGG